MPSKSAAATLEDHRAETPHTVVLAGNRWSDSNAAATARRFSVEAARTDPLSTNNTVRHAGGVVVVVVGGGVAVDGVAIV